MQKPSVRRTNILLRATVLFALFSRDAYANIVMPLVYYQFKFIDFLGRVWSVVIILLILTIETYFIRKLYQRNLLFCFVIACLANLLSCLFGIFVFSCAIQSFNRFSQGEFLFSTWGIYVSFVPGYLLTVAIEWLILMLPLSFRINEKKKMGRSLKTSVFMNLYSYLLLVAAVTIVLIKEIVIKRYWKF